MSRLPRVTARQMLSALQRAGFFVVRSKGSHLFCSIDMIQLVGQ
jgi:predicted RNA binding protein YcfA (HicA-like mRNA interferase family)